MTASYFGAGKWVGLKVKGRVAMEVNESLIIGVDFTDNQDASILIVGRQKNGVMNIVNAFTGKEAEDIYKKLTNGNFFK